MGLRHKARIRKYSRPLPTESFQSLLPPHTSRSLPLPQEKPKTEIRFAPLKAACKYKAAPIPTSLIQLLRLETTRTKRIIQTTLPDKRRTREINIKITQQQQIAIASTVDQHLGSCASQAGLSILNKNLRSP